MSVLLKLLIISQTYCNTAAGCVIWTSVPNTVCVVML